MKGTGPPGWGSSAGGEGGQGNARAPSCFPSFLDLSPRLHGGQMWGVGESGLSPISLNCHVGLELTRTHTHTHTHSHTQPVSQKPDDVNLVCVCIFVVYPLI